MRESAVSSHVRLAAAQSRVDLWRNNNGAFQDDTGRWVRYGLCNDSKKLSDRVKSSDLIGITPVMITPDMVGKVVGVFTAVETKPTTWHMTPGDSRAVAQKAFHDIVKLAGGFAGFARTVDEFKQIVRR